MGLKKGANYSDRNRIAAYVKAGRNADEISRILSIDVEVVSRFVNEYRDANHLDPALKQRIDTGDLEKRKPNAPEADAKAVKTRRKRKAKKPTDTNEKTEG